MQKFDLSTNWLLNVGMDGQSVNKAFLRLVIIELQKNDLGIIHIGSCPIHTANMAFKQFLNVLKPVIDVDEVAIDMHFFLKKSARGLQGLGKYNRGNGMVHEGACRFALAEH